MSEAISTLTELGRPILAIVFLALSGRVFGGATLERLGFDSGEKGSGSLATTLGLGLMAQVVFLLGLAGLIYPGIILALLALAHLLCRSTWARLLRSLPFEREEHGLWIVALSSPVVLMALYPETGFDATTYHLPFVHAFREAHALVFVPELRFPVFPQVGEMLFLLAEMLGGNEAAKWIALLSILLTASILAEWGKRLSSRRVGLWSAALWLGTPLVIWVGSMAYVDATLALFVTAAFASWQRSETTGDRWQILAAAFLGLAAGTKYLGAFFCLWFLASALRHDFKSASRLGLVVLLMAGPWYLRLIYHTGNPVFPFYESVFGESDWSSPESLERAPESTSGLAEWAFLKAEALASGIGFLVMLPWNAFFRREVFHYTAPLSPWLIGLVPLVLVAWRERWARSLLFLVSAYCLFWLTTIRDLRFLLPILPPVYLLISSEIDRFWPSRRTGAALTLFLLLPGPAYAVYKCVERGLPPTSADSVESYLEGWVPGYACLSRLHEAKGDRYVLYALGGERLRHYARGRFLGERSGPLRHRLMLPLFSNAERLSEGMGDLGVSHLLVDSKMRRLPSTDAFRSRFDLLFESSDGFLLYELRSDRGSTEGSRGL